MTISAGKSAPSVRKALGMETPPFSHPSPTYHIHKEDFFVILYVIFTLVQRTLDLLALLMFVGALASWFPGLDQYKVIQVINAVTGTVVDPVRRLFRRLGFAGGPIDFSYLIAMVLIEMLALAAGQLAAVFAYL